jgi:TatD DNase family protein
MSRPILFDVHTHTQFAALRGDQDAVIGRAHDAGIWIINVGTQKDTSASAVETARKYTEGVYAAIGLHPLHTERSYHDVQELGDAATGTGFTSRGEEFDSDYYRTLALDQKVVAIGECGLDYYRLAPETKKKQRETFIKHIELSAEVKKPLMIHCRQSFSDLIPILRSAFRTPPSPPGIVHFFTGSQEDAGKLLGMGFSFSFGGVITFARDYDEVVKYIPLDRILLETDAPYVAPVPYRGKRNEPSYLAEVAKKVAELKGISFEEACRITTQNALHLFAIG